MALDIIKRKNNRFHLYVALIQSIKDMLLKGWAVRLIHSWREGNVVVDMLAKMGAQNCSSWLTFKTPIAGVESTLALDACGTEYLRT